MVKRKRVSDSKPTFGTKLSRLAKKSKLPTDCFIALKLFTPSKIKDIIIEWLDRKSRSVIFDKFLSNISTSHPEWDKILPEKTLTGMVEKMNFYHLCSIIGYVEQQARANELKGRTIWDILANEKPNSNWAKRISSKRVQSLLSWKKQFKTGMRKMKEFATEPSGKVKKEYGGLDEKTRKEPLQDYEKVMKTPYQWWKGTKKNRPFILKFADKSP